MDEKPTYISSRVLSLHRVSIILQRTTIYRGALSIVTKKLFYVCVSSI